MRRFGFEGRKAKRAMEQEASSGREASIYSLRGRACGSSARTFSAAGFAQKDNRAWQPRARLPLPSAGAVDQFVLACSTAAEIPTIEYNVKGSTRVFHGTRCHIAKWYRAAVIALWFKNLGDVD